LEMGHFALEIHKQRLTFQELARQNPVSYLSYINEKLTREP
jgi:hypothetical protein